jgi:hypothetical protein
LYRENNSENDHTTLQNDLKNLEKWASDWGMHFNAKVLYPKHEEEDPPLLHIKQPISPEEFKCGTGFFTGVVYMFLPFEVFYYL